CGASSIDISHARNFDGLAVSWFRCAACSLVFQNPPMTAAAMRNEYAKRNYFCAAYDDYMRDDPIRLRQARKRLHLIERFNIPGVRLLDVGSASGFFGAVAQERGYHVTCIEPDQEMASRGRETYNLDIRAVALEEWELEPSNFDIVTLWGTDSHFSHPLEGFGKIAQALRPNGLLAMSYQDFDHWIRRIFPEIKVGWNVIFNL